MKSFVIFVLTLLTIGCNALDILEIENKILELTTELSSIDGVSDESKVSPDLCSQKCSEEIEVLKKNVSELYSLFMTLHSQLEHLNQHMAFHEKALKHIAIWGHKHKPYTKDNNQNITDESGLNEDSNRNMRGHSDDRHDHTHHHHNDHRHNHQHHQHSQHQHHMNRPHHSHNHKPPVNGNNPSCNQCPNPKPNPSCNQCPNPPPNCGGCPHILPEDDDLTKIKKNKEKDSSEESSEEEKQSKPPKDTVLTDSEMKSNESIALNDSQTINPSEKTSKRLHYPKNSAEEHLYFQTMQTEFKEWFNNMLNDIHHNNGRVDRSDNGLKHSKHSDQSTVDEMENVLNSEDLIFATCSVKPNRHIALLNQQEVEGTINLWQLRHNRGPLYMHIKLKGFKISNHEESHHKSRRVRESILMPVEAEPDETTVPIDSSHSHGFHVHEFGNMSRDCQSVGSHYNPLNLAHGGPFDVVRHVGDLGNIRCNQNGEIDSEFTYSQLSLSGIHTIINRSLVIHSNIDDYGRNPNSPLSSQTGSSGVRIACCVIEEVKQLPKEVDSHSNIGPVANPVFTSKRRRETSEPTFVNKNRYEDSNLSDILKKIVKYETQRKYKEFD